MTNGFLKNCLNLLCIRIQQCWAALSFIEYVCIIYASPYCRLIL